MDSRGSVALRSDGWRRGVVLAGMVLAAAGALALGHADRADAAPGACTKYWKGTFGTAWGNDNNWSNTNGGAASTVPGPTDVACMSTSPTTTTVAVTDTRSVAGLNFGGAGVVLQVNAGGALTVGTGAGNTWDSSIATLSLASGVDFGGTADVTVGTLGSLNSVDLVGTGSLTVNGATTLTGGTAAYVDGGYTFVNNGTLTASNTSFYFYNAANKVVNKGTWNSNNTSAAPVYDGYNNPASTFTNAAGAVFNVTPPLTTDTAYFQYETVVNNGTVNVTKGTLSVLVDEAGTGTWNVASGARLQLDGGVFDATSGTISGAGTFQLNSGGDLKGGTLGTASVVFSAGDLVGGATTTIPSGTSATLTGGTAAYLDGGSTLVNNGSVTANNSTLYLYNAANKVINNGTWTSRNTTAAPAYDAYNNPASTFTNAAGGVFNVTPPTAADTATFQYEPVVNNGTLNLTQGTLSLVVDQYGTGTFNTAAGTSLNVDSGTLDMTGGTYQISGNLNLNSSGYLKGSPTSLNAIVFNGGTVTGGGTTTLPTGSTATLNGNVYIDGGTTLVNNGALTSNNASVYFYDQNNKVVNTGTWTSKNTSAWPAYDPYSRPGSTFTNAAGGVFNISPPLTTDTANIASEPIANNGTVNVTRGTASLQVDAGGSGTWNVAAGAALNVDSGTLDMTGASFNVTGTLNVNSSGYLKGSPAALNSLVFNGGGLTGGGTTTLPTGSTTTLNANLYIDGATTLVNNGSLTSNNGTVYFYDQNNKVVNNGLWTSKNTTAWPVYDPYNRPGSTFTNSASGVFDVSPPLATDTPVFTSEAVVNNGQLNVTKGQLSIQVNESGTGTWTLASGTRMNLDSGTFDVTGATVNGAGTVHANGGGTITGTGSMRNVVFNSPTLNGTGTLTLATGGTSSIPSGQTLYMQNGYKLLNQGSLTQAGAFRLYNNPAVENAGSWLLTMSGSAVENYDGTAKQAWVNAATGVFTSQPGAANAVDLGPVRLTNLGELKNQNGTFNVSLTNLAGTTLTGGTLTVQAGTLGIQNNLQTIAAATTVTVNGGGITNTGTAATALTALRTVNGTFTTAVNVNPNGVVTNAGTVIVKGGTFRPNSYTQTAGITTVDAPGILKGGAAGTGAIAINGGTLTGGGNVQGPVTNAARVAPGGNGTPLSVSSSFAQTGTGEFAVAVSGATTPGTDFSQLTATGAATLNGVLAIQTGPSYDPAVGTSVRVLSAASRTGTFSSVTGIDTLPAGKYWSVGYDATGVTLTVKADPMASVNSVSATEGDSGTTPLVFTVSLDQASDRTVTYNYETVAQTATAPSDYAIASGTLTFLPGETSKTVAVTVNGDTTFEPNETLLLRLSGAVYGGIAVNDGVGTITNDDPEPPQVTVTAVSPNVVGQGAAATTITVTGTGFDPTSNITFNKTQIAKVAGTQTYVSPTTMRVDIAPNQNTPVGATDVTVTGAAGTATCTGCLTITPKPVVTALSPQLGAGAVKREVTITGSGFVPGATATIAGATVFSTSYIDANTLEVLVTIPTTRAPGTSQVIVTNPDRGRAVFNNGYATVAGVTVTGISQSTFARGTTATVTLTGTNVGPGVKLVGKSGISFDGVTRVNDTTITATITVTATAARGNGKAITVINPLSRGYGQSVFNLVNITS